MAGIIAYADGSKRVIPGAIGYKDGDQVYWRFFDQHGNVLEAVPISEGAAISFSETASDDLEIIEVLAHDLVGNPEGRTELPSGHPVIQFTTASEKAKLISAAGMFQYNKRIYKASRIEEKQTSSGTLFVIMPY